MNKLEEIDRKDLILRRKGEARYLKKHKKKLQNEICLNNTKKYSFPPNYFLCRMIDDVIMAHNNNLRKDWTNTHTKTRPHE